MKQFIKKLFAPIFLVCLCVVSLTGCEKAVALDVKVGDAAFSLRDTISSLYDQGLCIVEGLDKKVELSDLGTLTSRTKSMDIYSIGAPKEDGVGFTGIYVYVYNDGLKEASIGDCQIYRITYSNRNKVYDGDIYFGDIHMDDTKPSDALDKMDASGIALRDKDKENTDKFCSDESGYFVLKRIGNLMYELKSNVSYSEPEEIDYTQYTDENGDIDYEAYEAAMEEAQAAVTSELYVTEFEYEYILKTN